MRLTYRTNNSGGSWWLSDKDWKKLEERGWKVAWKEERWLGALACEAEKEFDSVRLGIKEWEEILGKDASEEGCNCCGAPHTFSWEDYEGNYNFVSGEDILGLLYKDVGRISLRQAYEKLSDGE